MASLGFTAYLEFKEKDLEKTRLLHNNFTCKLKK